MTLVTVVSRDAIVHFRNIKQIFNWTNNISTNNRANSTSRLIHRSSALQRSWLLVTTVTENNNPRASTIVAPVFALPKMFAEWPFPLIGRTSFSDQAFS